MRRCWRMMLEASTCMIYGRCAGAEQEAQGIRFHVVDDGRRNDRAVARQRYSAPLLERNRHSGRIVVLGHRRSDNLRRMILPFPAGFGISKGRVLPRSAKYTLDDGRPRSTSTPAHHLVELQHLLCQTFSPRQHASRSTWSDDIGGRPARRMDEQADGQEALRLHQ